MQIGGNLGISDENYSAGASISEKMETFEECCSKF